MKISTRKSSLHRGQSIVEFAIVIPLLLTLMFGIMEIGRAFWIYSAVASASREAARFGSSIDENGSGTPNYLDCAGIRPAAHRIGDPGQVTDSDIVITYDEGPNGNIIGACPVAAVKVSLGDRIVVVVTGHFDPVAAIPFIDFPSFDITSESRRTIVKHILINSTAEVSP